MGEEYKYKRYSTTSDQIEFLVTFMENHPELVCGQVTAAFTSQKKRHMWEELIKKLNSMNPTVPKTMDRWKKIWVDKKSNVRNKAMLFKRNMKNKEQDKIPKFTLLEKRIMKVIGLRHLSQICPPYIPHLPLVNTTENHMKISGPRISFSSSLLPTMTNCQSEELMENQQLEVDGTLKSQPVISKDAPSLMGNPPLLLSGEPLKTKESRNTLEKHPESNLEKQIIVKQEPPEDILYETSSPAALEPQNPIIVSIVPVLTVMMPPSPIINFTHPELTENAELPSPAISSPGQCPTTKNLQPCNMINTAEIGKPGLYVLEPNSDNQVTIKQELPDDTPVKTSSSPALESVNPIIVSVTPMSTSGEFPVPKAKLSAPGLTERIEPQSPVIGSPAPSPSTVDPEFNTMTNTAQGTRPGSQVIELDSDNQMESTEELSKNLHKDANLSLLLNEGRRNAFRLNKGKQSVAIKAANALTDMAERNCIVLERIATAIEIQAAQSVKQTQLIEKLIGILSKK